MSSSNLLKKGDTSKKVASFSMPSIDSIEILMDAPAVEESEIASETDQDLKPATPTPPRISENFKHKINALIARSRENATHILDSARKEAGDIRIDALEKARQEGFQKGFAEGVEQGISEGVERLTPLLDSAKNISCKLIDIDSAIQENMESMIVGLSLAVAEKVINAEVKTNRDIVVNTVRTAIKYATDRGEITVKVNPDDYHTLSRYKSDFIESVDGISRLTFVEDESVPSGNCVIDTDIGEIDARFKSQLEEIGQAFTAEIASNDTTQIEADYL